MINKFFIITVLIAAGVYAAEEDVLEWGDGDFLEELKRHDHTLVMFYAPWCGHCKKLKPEYAKAAELLRGSDPPITLAKVDCTEAGKDTCNRYSVSGYPTLKIFAGTEMVNEYNGPRDAAGLAKYMKGQVGPASKELTDAAALKAFLGSDDVVVVGYFEKENSPLAEAFQTVAKKLREKVQFAHTTNKELLEKEGLKNNVVLYRPKNLHNKFEDSKLTFKDSVDAGELTEFVKNNYFGIAGIRTRDNHMDFKNPLVVAYYNVDYVKNPKGTNYWRNRVLKVAKEFPDFSYAISNKDEFQHDLNEFGIDFVKGDKPVVVARDEKNQKFVMNDEFSLEAFEIFLTDLQSGSLEPYQKSEPIPESNDGPVKVAVSKNFDEVVTNNDKDILVEFYAPWCGHCKKLAPVFDELGEKMADEEVEIVKMDATANDVPSLYDVRGFPTLYWVPKNSKSNPVRYDGGRDLEDFIKYIAKHSTDGLKGWDRSGSPAKHQTDEL